jgi:biotin carboxyl carrier protein
MKMEFTIAAPHDGVVADVRCTPRKPVAAGQTVIVLGTARAA